jgi:hypothetical protein
MLKHSFSQAKVLTVLGICALIGPASKAADVRVTAVKLSVEVDRQSNCKLSLNANIQTTGEGSVWYRFQGPDGASFDFGQDDTMSVLGTGGGVGKGVTIEKDIKGEFRLEAAMVGEGGKRGPVTLSNSVPANYTCGGGSSVARPIPDAAVAPATPPRKSRR